MVALMFAAALAAASPPPSLTVDLLPQHGSKVSGQATIAHAPDTIDVTIVMDGVFVPETRYPAGVYAGTCAKLGAAPVFRLAPVSGGRSTTHLDPSIARTHPMAGPYAIAVFNAAGTQTLWCGALPRMEHTHPS